MAALTQYQPKHADLRVDVSTASPTGEPAAIAARVHLPADRPTGVLICWPGGSYGMNYWQFEAPGRTGYSFADHMTRRGFMVIAADHLGVGGSSKPQDGDSLTLDAMARAAVAFVADIRKQLAAGELVSGLPPLGGVSVVGVGHSLGGCLVVVQQALGQCYDAIVSLGYTHGSKDASTGNQMSSEGVSADDAAAVRAVATDQAKFFFGDTWDDVYGRIDRPAHHGWLHGPDVPADVIALDDMFDEAWPRASYVHALMPGATVRYAAAITSPVFLGFGEHDVPPEPRDDVSFYTGSDDITLFVLPGSYHCSNFATRRADLWRRIDAWVRSLPAPA
jgi:alpha-beta hydrolase superfamily lysophospholipase